MPASETERIAGAFVRADRARGGTGSMPNDLSVGRMTGPPSSTAATPTAAPAQAPAQPSAGQNLPNPTLRLDPALGIVVIEFHDGQGVVKSSIPTQHQLDAYRTAERTQSKPASDAGTT